MDSEPEPVNSLKALSLASQAYENVLLVVKTIENIKDHKYNVDFINFVCDVVEALFIDAKKLKVNKKDETIKIINKVISNCPNGTALNEQDKKVIDNIIESLHSRNLIKGCKEKKTIFKKCKSLILGKK